ncbi:MAG: DUF4375 domain-containing protein [Chitinophagaceae bacterium]|nr:DUF4375 domain-containing protein [Chitinophagaceae bacterium]
MSSNFLPSVNATILKKAINDGDLEQFYDLLVQPLHEELYRRQSFEFLDDLSWAQQLLLAYDYVHMQVGQGGFIQFIQNGYISLLPSVIEQLYKLDAPEMAQVLDDVLKVYVLNREQLERQTTVEEFAKLYDEFREFEDIDARFQTLHPATTRKLLDHAAAHLNEFVTEA